MPRHLLMFPLLAGCLPLITQPWSEIEAGLEDSGEDTSATEHPTGDFESYTVDVIFGWDHDAGTFPDVAIGDAEYGPIGIVTFLKDGLECPVVFTFEAPLYQYWTYDNGYHDGVWAEAADIDAGISAAAPDECDEDEVLALFDDLAIQGATIGVLSDEMSDFISENLEDFEDVLAGGGIVYGDGSPTTTHALGLAYTEYSTDAEYRPSNEIYDADGYLVTGAYEIYTPVPIPL